MKNIYKILVLLLIAACSLQIACKGNKGSNNDKYNFEYNIGDSVPGGGIVFYRSAAGFTINGTEYHYLVADIADISGTHQWASTGKADKATNAALTAIGTGWANTNTILAVDSTAPAAKACRDKGSAWFLPSKDELNELYEQKDKVGGFDSDYYWSSSEFGSDCALYKGFSNGGDGYYGKDSTYSVRAVRAF